MNTFKILSWNVNSLRVRLPHLLQLLTIHTPDVIALQETKLIDEDFPLETIHQSGYTAFYAGQPSYNGVAILSRQPATETMAIIPGLEDPQKRFLAATVGDTRVINLYVPNGESVASEKFNYKLNWLEKLTDYLEDELKKYPKVVIVGDFNIAPHPIDVHDPKMWDGKVLFSQPERAAFDRLLSLGLNDCFRHVNPEAKDYSWWDYRLNAFKRNLGLRIDHVLSSGSLIQNCHACFIDAEPRGWERPSDHAPVIAEFAFK